MKQGSGISASVGAILGSLASLSCCLPLGFAAALGTGAASAFLTTLHPWLLGLSVILIAFGFWQQRQAKQCAVKGRVVLATDWRAPSGSTRGRIGDARAQQFWDPNHLVAQQVSMIAKEKPQAEPACCVNKGNHWDEAILSHRHRTEETYQSLCYGPVVRSVSQLDSRLRSLP